MCRAKEYVFLAVLVWNRVSISTILVWNRVWSRENEVWFVHSSLEFCIYALYTRISFFFIVWQKDHFPFNVHANYRVRAVTACHALWSSAGLQGFRSEIGCQIFDQVWNRVGKMHILVWNRVRVSRSVPHTSSRFFWKYPPPPRLPNSWDTKGRSLCQAFLAETVEIGTKNLCVILRWSGVANFHCMQMNLVMSMLFFRRLKWRAM